MGIFGTKVTTETVAKPTFEELKNPTGILTEEYSRIMKQLKENKQYENRNCSK